MLIDTLVPYIYCAQDILYLQDILYCTEEERAHLALGLATGARGPDGPTHGTGPIGPARIQMLSAQQAVRGGQRCDSVRPLSARTGTRGGRRSESIYGRELGHDLESRRQAHVGGHEHGDRGDQPAQKGHGGSELRLQRKTGAAGSEMGRPASVEARSG